MGRVRGCGRSGRVLQVFEIVKRMQGCFWRKRHSAICFETSVFRALLLNHWGSPRDLRRASRCFCIASRCFCRSAAASSSCALLFCGVSFAVIGSLGISEVGLNGETSVPFEGEGGRLGDFEGDAAGLFGFGEDAAELGLLALVGFRVGISLSGDSGIVGFSIDFGAMAAATYPRFSYY